MKQGVALLLAVTLVTVGAPAIAHQAAYPSECDSRVGENRCQAQDGQPPAHKACDGQRKQINSYDHDDDSESQTEETREVLDRKLSLPVGPGVDAYVQASGSTTQSQTTGTPMPGLIWIEDNGFSGLQRTDWKCLSNDHANPNEPEVHADTVLI